MLSLMNTAGEKCRRILDSKIRNVSPKYVQADELHSYVGTRGKNFRSSSPKEHGDRWLWLALDSETKMILSYLVDERTLDAAHKFIGDLSNRTKGTFQLSADALKAYGDAVDAWYATQIHYGTVIKMYGSPDVSGPDWYSTTNRVIGVVQKVRCGRPEKDRISTSHVERLNLSVRTHLKRFARATNAHSRKLENHKNVVCLWVAWYNFVRVNTAVRMTPTMASGITNTIWTMRDLLST